MNRNSRLQAHAAQTVSVDFGDAGRLRPRILFSTTGARASPSAVDLPPSMRHRRIGRALLRYPFHSVPPRIMARCAAIPSRKEPNHVLQTPYHGIIERVPSVPCHGTGRCHHLPLLRRVRRLPLSRRPQGTRRPRSAQSAGCRRRAQGSGCPRRACGTRNLHSGLAFAPPIRQAVSEDQRFDFHQQQKRHEPSWCVNAPARLAPFFRVRHDRRDRRICRSGIEGTCVRCRP